jgi:hypothetical protein
MAATEEAPELSSVQFLLRVVPWAAAARARPEILVRIRLLFHGLLCQVYGAKIVTYSP